MGLGIDQISSPVFSVLSRPCCNATATWRAFDRAGLESHYVTMSWQPPCASPDWCIEPKRGLLLASLYGWLSCSVAFAGLRTPDPSNSWQSCLLFLYAHLPLVDAWAGIVLRMQLAWPGSEAGLMIMVTGIALFYTVKCSTLVTR